MLLQKGRRRPGGPLQLPEEQIRVRVGEAGCGMTNQEHDR